jgi:hypothetical protein
VELDAVKSKAERLFLQFDKEFGLTYCEATKSYSLKNPKVASCHPLELYLIADRAFSGRKLKDLMDTTSKGYRWIIGFCHGYSGLKSRYKHIEYVEGYTYGCAFGR